MEEAFDVGLGFLLVVFELFVEIVIVEQAELACTTIQTALKHLSLEIKTVTMIPLEKHHGKKPLI